MQTSDVRLIVDLADAVRNAAPIVKDPEAERLIDQLIGTQPDALYFLVQTVLLQKEALATQAGSSHQATGDAPPAAPVAPAAVPDDRRGRWSGMFGGRRESASEPAAAGSGGGGSFLRTAAAGAAGVAGGVLLAQGISGLFSPPPAPPVDAGYDDGDDGGWDDMGDVF